MLLAPSRDDVRVILCTSGIATGLFGVAILVIATPTLAAGDLNSATALVCGAAPAIIVGSLARMMEIPRRHLTWTRGVVVAVTTWCLCALTVSISLYLSGHYGTWVDALFEAMSGLTNTGLTMVADLDHMPTPFVLLRSLTELVGGLMFLGLTLGLLSTPSMMASTMDPTDVRDERILPQPTRVWRRARRLVTTLLGVGLPAVVVALLLAGVPIAAIPVTAVTLTIAAATTGGFQPFTGAIGSFHSQTLELVLMLLMIGGATSVAVHALARRGQYRRLLRELDLRLFMAIAGLTLVGTIVGLARADAQDGVFALARHGVFLTVSAITTTGFSSVAPRLLATDFGVIAPALLVAAMAVGGMAGSMAGGVTGLRVGFLLKGLRDDVRRVLLPQSAVVRSHFRREGRTERLSDAHVRSAATVVLLSLGAILVGGALLLWVDGSVTLSEAMLTATSTVSNAGIDVGVLTPADPTPVKLVFTALMLLGRLDWLAVFAAAGYLVACLRGRLR